MMQAHIIYPFAAPSSEGKAATAVRVVVLAALRLGARAGYLLGVPQFRTRLVWSLALSALIGSSACGGSSKPGEGGAAAPGSNKPRYQIAVIPKGTTH